MQHLSAFAQEVLEGSRLVYNIPRPALYEKHNNTMVRCSINMRYALHSTLHCTGTGTMHNMIYIFAALRRKNEEAG